MLLFGRASPAGRADEDVHNPSADGLGTYRGRRCAKIRYFRSYRGIRNWDVSVTGFGASQGRGR